MPEQRSTPEQSLQHVQEEENKAKRGKLKIYLGAAPGVGKTYQMLHDAYENRLKNLDVVIGVAESHGREKIEEMRKKFEIIPPQKIKYRDKTLLEFDLNAALKRDPGLILVDEMAHTNAQGLRHAKRWQDIQELLDRGIDVYTTLNVQHIESLKDDVAQIIQAPIKETVPDVMIELANTIELVDLPVDELLKRLYDGKIYIPKQAQLATEHFFRKGNLIALRELALRTTAACVEAEVLLYRKAEGIKQIWPTRDKILVCVGSDPDSLRLIRTAKRIANGLQAEWIAVYVDTPKLHRTAKKRNSAIKNLRLAQQLGAETQVLIGIDIAKEVLRFARERNVTQIMVWKYTSFSWRHLFKRHISDNILKQSGEINVFVVTSEAPKKKIKKEKESHPFAWKFYGLSVGIIGLATLLNATVSAYVAPSNLIMVYLLCVMVVALFGQTGPSLLASILSVLAYDFFFLSPVSSFTLTDFNYLLTLGMMFLVTQVIVHLTLLKHQEAKLARQIQQQTRALYDFSHQLLIIRGVSNLINLGVSYLSEIFDSEVFILMLKNNHFKIFNDNQSKPILSEKELSVAQWVYEMKQAAGLGTDTLSSANALYLPLRGEEQTLGVLRIQPKNKVLFSPEQLRLLDSCVNQLTLAIEVAQLEEKSSKKKIKIEVDYARDDLLKTISDHLNYPLKFILEAMQGSNGKQIKLERVKVNDEINKINLINNNILQIIEFESHLITLNKKRVYIQEMVYSAIETFRKQRKDKQVKLSAPKKNISITIDEGRMQEVFANLFDNADKYSSPESIISILIRMDKNNVEISMENESSSIANEDITKLFKKFYRGRKLTNGHGLGLGLTICQKIIEAHKGQIWAEYLETKGIVAFRFVLPINQNE